MQETFKMNKKPLEPFNEPLKIILKDKSKFYVWN